MIQVIETDYHKTKSSPLRFGKSLMSFYSLAGFIEFTTLSFYWVTIESDLDICEITSGGFIYLYVTQNQKLLLFLKQLCLSTKWL